MCEYNHKTIQSCIKRLYLISQCDSPMKDLFPESSLLLLTAETLFHQTQENAFSPDEWGREGSACFLNKSQLPLPWKSRGAHEN